ncbi:non-specific lipid transfer protein GPI-anchored 2-like, partial [Asparagus officinalis]|uniref:non-specific lipid transfer protein GPI-anchored 2-like n=1 Tax=Asparagus officinalis TaxID=4686 RepID=UPI00098E4941
MAERQLSMGLTLVFIVTMWAGSFAQPSCPPPMVSLQPCLGFITGNSSSNPPPQCCTQLASMVQSQAQCLCQVLSLAPQLPLPVNRTQAVTLPGACNIQVPPLSQCNAQSGPSTPTTPSGPFIPAA